GTVSVRYGVIDGVVVVDRLGLPTRRFQRETEEFSDPYLLHPTSDVWPDFPFPTPPKSLRPNAQRALPDFQVRECVASKPTGGVYLGSSSSHGRVVIKEALHHAGYDHRGVDAGSRLDRESQILQHLSSRKLGQ